MRVGLLGGSFDPVHFGHLRAAQCALEVFDLAQVRLMPARQSPFKMPCHASEAHRRTMVGLAVLGNESLGVEDCELDRPIPSYTVDTLRTLTQREPNTRFTLILGSDAAQGLESWREIAEVQKMAEIRTLARPDDSAAGNPQAVPFEGLSISSTTLREAIKAGRSIRYLTPDPVCLYIEEKGLYK